MKRLLTIWLFILVILGSISLVSRAFGKAESKAENKGSDWYGSSSGWVEERDDFYNGRAPKGTWIFEYKHWFNDAEPEEWTKKSHWTKPPADEYPSWPFWDSRPDDKTSPSNGSKAESEWEVENQRYSPFCNNRGVWYKTKSYAFAKGGGAGNKAHSKTRIVDPWEFTRPDTGNWSIGGSIAFDGEIYASPGDTALYEIAYYAAHNDSQFENAQEILYLHIGADSNDVTLTHSLRVHLTRNGLDLTADSIIAEIKSHYIDSMHWEFLSGFGPDSIGPNDSTMGYSQAIYFDIAYWIDSEDSLVTLFNRHITYASDVQPSPCPPFIVYNDTDTSASQIVITFSGSGGNLRECIVTGNPPGCPAPTCFAEEDTVVIDWDDCCFDHSETVEFEVYCDCPCDSLEIDSVGWIVFVEDKKDAPIPTVYGLAQNHPNPFNPITEINYALPKDSRVRLEIYNILGQKVTTLVDQTQRAGYKSARWDAESLSSGIYFYRLQAGDFVQTRKMVLLK